MQIECEEKDVLQSESMTDTVKEGSDINQVHTHISQNTGSKNHELHLPELSCSDTMTRLENSTPIVDVQNDSHDLETNCPINVLSKDMCQDKIIETEKTQNDASIQTKDLKSVTINSNPIKEENVLEQTSQFMLNIDNSHTAAFQNPELDGNELLTDPCPDIIVQNICRSDIGRKKIFTNHANKQERKFG